MHLAIDLRFYRPEPFGLAVHIRDLFTELMLLFEQENHFDQVTLILDKKNEHVDLSSCLPWWSSLQNSDKIKPYFSSSPYYSLLEQTLFLYELERINPDLTFFFNFNFPFFFQKPFFYQILDLTIHKTKPNSPKLFLAKKLMQAGLQRAKHTFFLGSQTRDDAEQFSGLNFSDLGQMNFRPNSVFSNGINPKYLSQKQSNKSKSILTKQHFSSRQAKQLKNLQARLKIEKKYFLFVSVWRRYKNIEALVEAFSYFNESFDNRYQLVLAGKTDPKYPYILQFVQNSKQFKNGNILTPGALADEELICLQDGALGYISPSLFEGFGLTLVEAAARGTPVICSDIEVFRDILPNQSALFFDPKNVTSIQNSLSEFIQLNHRDRSKLVTKGFLNSQRFTWAKTAGQIYKVLANFSLS